MTYVSQIIIQYALNLHSAICQLQFNKTGRKKNIISERGRVKWANMIFSWFFPRWALTLKRITMKSPKTKERLSNQIKSYFIIMYTILPIWNNTCTKQPHTTALLNVSTTVVSGFPYLSKLLRCHDWPMKQLWFPNWEIQLLMQNE